KFQILLKIHEFESKLNENHENQAYFPIGLIVFDLILKNPKLSCCANSTVSLIFETAGLTRKPITKSKSAFNFDYSV
ncbi:Uncharacterized protein APZ42_003533, partial [Daphnia magna]